MRHPCPHRKRQGHKHRRRPHPKAAPPKLIGRKGELCASFVNLQDDGSTSCGNWLYSQSYTQKEGEIINMMARRKSGDPTGIGLFPEWAWCWPVNRRILHNRASVDLTGRPWDPKRAVLKWNPEKLDKKTQKPGVWEGDVPDGPAPPMAEEKGTYPFIMKPDGKGAIFGPELAEGPFPEHYEAIECPLPENPMSGQRINPAVKILYARGKATPGDTFASCDFRFPLVSTTYRVSEHWQTGVMTRHEPWQLEMAPVDADCHDSLRGVRRGDSLADHGL